MAPDQNRGLPGRFGVHLVGKKVVVTHSRCTYGALPDYDTEFHGSSRLDHGGDTVHPGLAPEEPRLSTVVSRCIPDSAGC